MSEILARGEVLSPSQVRCFMDCQMRWWFKYVLKCADPATGKMALGRAVHAALTQNFAQKVETQEDLPVTGVLALFRDAWAREREREPGRCSREDAAPYGEEGCCGARGDARLLVDVYDVGVGGAS